MRLGGGREVFRHADVQLLGSHLEPGAPATAQRLGLLDLRQPEQAPVEAARLGLAAGRRGDLHVVEGEDQRMVFQTNLVLAVWWICSSFAVSALSGMRS